MAIENIISLFAAIGIGSILGAFFQSRFEHQKQIKEQEHELKRKRYGAILILLLTKLDPKNGMSKLTAIRPDLRKLTDVEKEIEIELLNGILYASDNVIRTLVGFVKNPDHSSYTKVAVAMRKDLWRNKTSIDEKTIELTGKK